MIGYVPAFSSRWFLGYKTGIEHKVLYVQPSLPQTRMGATGKMGPNIYKSLLCIFLKHLVFVSSEDGTQIEQTLGMTLSGNSYGRQPRNLSRSQHASKDLHTGLRCQ